MRETVLLIHHHPDLPHDDRVTNLLTARGIPFQHVYPFRGDPLPTTPEKFSAGVLYGGAQNMDEIEKYPFLVTEQRWIELCLKHDKPFLGICLGAQSLAHVLGAEVRAMDPIEHEFGFYPVRGIKTGQDIVPEELFVVQAHYQGFDIPDGAEKLAHGDTFPNQAMRYGRSAYGLQFHPEVTPPMFRRWQESDWAPYGKPGVQSREEQDRALEIHEPTMAAWFDGFLERFLELTPAEEAA